MFGMGFKGPVRLQQTPIWHYINSDQWRYDGNQADYNTVPKNDLSGMHSADMTVKAVRNGWMPFYPQYNKNNFEIVADAEKAGAKRVGLKMGFYLGTPVAICRKTRVLR